MATFIPKLVVAGLIQEKTEGRVKPPKPVVPRHDNYFAVCMLADLSGFSRVADQLSRQGARGMDTLSEVLGTLFGRLIGVVDYYEGDVYKVRWLGVGSSLGHG